MLALLAIYQNRDWGMFDKDDVKHDDCMPLPDIDYECGTAVGRAEGYRKLRCIIDYTVDDLNGNLPD